VRVLGLHAAVAAVYVTLGVFIPQLLISWPVGVAFFVLGVWAVPTVVRRLR
jgi:hypothetical protein